MGRLRKKRRLKRVGLSASKDKFVAHPRHPPFVRIGRLGDKIYFARPGAKRLRMLDEKLLGAIAALDLGIIWKFSNLFLNQIKILPVSKKKIFAPPKGAVADSYCRPEY